jgi:AbiTii-like protein
MTDEIPPSRQALREALVLSEEILRNIELDELPLANIALKVSRFARLLNDFSYQKVMGFEASGYPSTPTGVAADIYQLAVLAGREYQQKDSKTDVINNYIYTTSIEELEQELKSFEAALTAARDPDVSVSSANPNQMVWNPVGNKFERDTLRTSAARAQRKLSSRRSFIYSYVLRRNYELKFSGIAGDIFSRIRENVDSAIGGHVPDAAQKLSAVYENLQSENSEDWSNAVHSCRRILQDLSDSIFPEQDDRVIEINGKQKTIKLGKDNHINRLMAFIDDHSDSERFSEIVGSQLDYIGNRLDSVFKAAQKGSHANIVSREEADRYVVYTYLIVGDILSLL